MCYEQFGKKYKFNGLQNGQCLVSAESRICLAYLPRGMCWRFLPKRPHHVMHVMCPVYGFRPEIHQ